MQKKLLNTEFKTYLQKKRESTKLTGEDARRTLTNICQTGKNTVDELSKIVRVEWVMYSEPQKKTIEAIGKKLDELQEFIDAATKTMKGYLDDDNLRSKVPKRLSYRDNFK